MDNTKGPFTNAVANLASNITVRFWIEAKIKYHKDAALRYAHYETLVTEFYAGQHGSRLQKARQTTL